MGTVLILEDEDQVREALGKQLKNLGQDVFTSSSAEDAWELFDQAPGKFDTVLVGIAIEPGDRGSGPKFLENARKRLPPEVAIYLMSAYAETGQPVCTDRIRSQR